MRPMNYSKYRPRAGYIRFSWNWLVCVRFLDRGHRRSYALTNGRSRLAARCTKAAVVRRAQDFSFVHLALN
jgi:hypothetical protein